MRYNKIIPEPLITDVVNALKSGTFFPYKLRLARCPTRKKTCRKRHGEAVITGYDEKKDEFNVNHYAVHQKGIIYELEMKPSAVKNLFQKSREKRLITLSELKELAKSPNFLSEDLHIRISENDKKQLVREAKQKRMEFSDYVREKLLS